RTRADEKSACGRRTRKQSSENRPQLTRASHALKEERLPRHDLQFSPDLGSVASAEILLAAVSRRRCRAYRRLQKSGARGGFDAPQSPLTPTLSPEAGESEKNGSALRNFCSRRL